MANQLTWALLLDQQSSVVDHCNQHWDNLLILMKWIEVTQTEKKSLSKLNHFSTKRLLLRNDFDQFILESFRIVSRCRWHKIHSWNEKSFQESRVPELLNKTVASKKNLKFCETTENVDFVAEIVIAEGEIEGFRYKIDGYQDKINRLRQLERLSGPYRSSKTGPNN